MHLRPTLISAHPFCVAILSLLFLAALPIGTNAAAGARLAAAAAPHNGATEPGTLLKSSPAVSVDHQRSSLGQAFPLLRWLRDSAIEMVFGPPRTGGRGGKHDGIPTSSFPQNVPSRAQTQSRRYRNDVVVRFNVSTAGEKDALSAAVEQLFLDVWASTGNHVDVRLHRDDVASLMTLLPSSLSPSVLIPDLARAVWGTYPSGSSAKDGWDAGLSDVKLGHMSAEGVDNIFFRDYQPLSVITSWLKLLEAMFPTSVRPVDVGKSYEGRDIPAVRLTVDRPANGTLDGERRKTILITGGIHAREWISTSTVNYLIWSLATAYGKDPLLTRLIQNFDFVLVPVLNPDGYEYTWQSDRLWRKSRQQTNMRFCRGLDLDHAFGYKWDAAATAATSSQQRQQQQQQQQQQHQSDPCSESYGGDQPFQAVEASRLASWAREETRGGAVELVGLLDLHSYSQQILFPYSYTCSEEPPNEENLEELALGLAKAMRLSSGEVYSVGSACEAGAEIESGGGSAIDWFYHEMKARFSYQIKLRDTGSYGFLLPPENIVPAGEEMVNAVKYFGDFLLGNNGIEKLSVEKADTKAEDLPEWRDLRRRRRR